MKNLLKILILIIAMYQFSFSQVVTTMPSIPTQYDSIIVYFDATKGDAGLKGFTGDVFAHTGVITNLSKDNTDWKYVMAPWATNYSDIKLTRDSLDHYHLVIGYPRTYYSNNHQNLGAIPANEKILKLAFVFRNSDGSKTGRDVGGADIFYNLYESGLTLVVNNPQVSVPFSDPQRSPAFVREGEIVPINISAVELGTKVLSLTLYVDGNKVTQSNTNSLIYNFNHSNFSVGAHNVKVVGIDTTNIVDSTLFMMFVNPDINNAALPAGLRPGINYTSPTSATLALFVPHKSFIYVLGDFNDWKVETNYFMDRDSVNADSVIWWVDINSLSPGKEYAFQYLADGQIRTGDPYSEKILDPWNDSSITAATYPNLKPYPAGKTQSIVSILQTDQSNYPWQVPNFPKPPKENLVIYELLVRDFSSQQNYQFLIDTLSYLKSLGVNAIELMPIMEFSGNLSWGYNPIYHTAVDKYYGTADKLKEFIDLCHQNGIAVILDMVLNQADNLSPLAMLWWDNANNRPAANNPYLNPIARHPYNVFNDFNHESSATKYFVDRVTEHWLTKFKFDGFRFDLSKGFTQKYTTDVGAWSAYDQSRINILERMANKIWQVDSTAYVILEHFADNSEETVLSNFGMMLWGNENCNYNQATMGYPSGPCSWDFSGISYKSRGWSNPNLVGYMESHDEERLMYKNEQYGNSSPYYQVKPIPNGLSRMGLASAFFLTIPGPKMIWQFGELGYDYSIDYNGRVGNKPIRWDYFNDPDRHKLYKIMSALIKLRNSYPVFQTTSSMNVSDSLKSIKFSDSSMKVNIIGNFSVWQTSMNPNFQQTGTWYDYFTGDSIIVTDFNSPISLQPSKYFIYTTVKLPKPDIGEEDQNGNIVVDNFKLEQNYPNPFNPSTVIRYSILSPSFVTLKIYDILGREVKTLVNQEQTSGMYDVKWNGVDKFGNKVSTGVYLYRIDAGNFSDVKKMMLIK